MAGSIFWNQSIKNHIPQKIITLQNMLHGITEDADKTPKKKKFDPENVNFEAKGAENVDPIKMNDTDSKFLFDNEDAIVFNLKKGNPNG